MCKPYGLRPSIASEIRRIRCEAKMSQTEFGRLFHYGPMDISYMENGRKLPSRNMLDVMSKKFGVEYRQLAVLATKRLRYERAFKIEDKVVKLIQECREKQVDFVNVFKSAFEKFERCENISLDELDESYFEYKETKRKRKWEG